MRMVLTACTLAFMLPMATQALAEDCTGENCSPPASQSAPPATQGEHECEREKKDDVTS